MEDFKTTEAHRRAVQKYRATNIKKYAFEVHKTNERELYEYLESLENKQRTIKDAIRNQMKKDKGLLIIDHNGNEYRG